MSETRETAIERRLSTLCATILIDGSREGDEDRRLVHLARDLVRCWREYLAALDSGNAVGCVRCRHEARVLLARGDAQ